MDVDEKKEKFQKLWPDHKMKEICEMLGVTRQTGSRWRRELDLPYKRRPFTKKEVKFIKKHPDLGHSEVAIMVTKMLARVKWFSYEEYS